jgi:hypothetical protein
MNLMISNINTNAANFFIKNNNKQKGIALWLIENTAVSFKQIADFCGLHILEIEALANGELNSIVKAEDPILMNLLNKEIIDECSQNELKPLSISNHNAITIQLASQQSKSKYTTIVKKKDKPDAIAWLIKNHPYVSDNQIIKLIGTTKNTITSIRNKTYKMFKNLKPRSPVILGLCTNEQLENVIMYAKVSYDRMRMENASDQDNENFNNNIYQNFS